MKRNVPWRLRALLALVLAAMIVAGSCGRDEFEPAQPGPDASQPSPPVGPPQNLLPRQPVPFDEPAANGQPDAADHDDAALSLRTAHYVGAEACRECHVERVESFVKTTHHRSTREPSADDVIGHFTPPGNVLRTRNDALHFEMSRDGDVLQQTAAYAAPGGEYRRTERVGIVVGSGKLTESYMYWRGDELYQLPVTHMRPWDTWSNSPGYSDGVAHFLRQIQPRCLECHATYFEPRGRNVATTNRYNRDNFILGIGCERCHGPASAHVAFHRSHRDEKVGQYIVDPRSMTRKQELDQCGQCHSAPGHHLTTPFSYIPGDPLEEYLAMTDGRSTDSFVHTSDQIQQLRDSACFQQTDTLNCITCHDPHQPEPRDPSMYAQRCLSCHRADHCTEGVKLPEAMRNDCVQCHMPARRNIILEWFTADDDFLHPVIMTEHHIGVHRQDAQRHVIEWHLKRSDEALQAKGRAMAAELADELVAKAQQMAAADREQDALETYRDALRLVPTHAQAQQLADALREAMRDKRTATDAQMTVQGLVVEANELVKAGRFDESLRLYELALQINGEHPAAIQNYANTLFRVGRLDEAIAVIRRAMAVDPDSADALFNLGNYLASDGRLDEALDAFERAAKLDGDFPQLDARLAMVRQAMDGGDPAWAHIQRGEQRMAAGEFDLAERHFAKAIELRPRVARAHLRHGDALRALGRTDEAAKAYEQAATLRPDWPEAQEVLEATEPSDR